MTPIRRRLTENLGAKLLALGLALVVFGGVYLDTEHELDLDVRLVVERPPDMVLVSQPPPLATIRVSAKGRLALKLRSTPPAESGVFVAVRLDGDETDVRRVLARGDVVVPLDLPVNVLAIIEPKALTLSLDERLTREVDVEAALVGSPPEGFDISGEVTIAPSAVAITGPERIVEGLEGVRTRPIDTSTWDRPVSERVEISLPRGLTAHPGTVAVHADVEPVSQLKLDAIPVAVRNARRYLVDVTPDSGAVTLFGPRSRLDRLGERAARGEPTGITIHVDAAGLGPGTHTVTPSVDLAGGLRIIGIHPAEFQLHIRDANESSPGSR